MTIDFLKQHQLIVSECISGSHAYGLATPESDTDIRGVYVLPQSYLYGLEYVPQINNETNDITYYELRRFIELLTKNNPSILELLNTPADCILYEHPFWAEIKQINFLSKLCESTFAGYAMTQIKKARGLNKKILNPVEVHRKNLLDFCQVSAGGGSMPVVDWLEKNQYQQTYCGLAKLANMRDLFALYYDTTDKLGYKGIIQKDISNEVSLSSIPKGEVPLAYLSFNIDGYSSYCKEYREYWEWVEKRNDARYQNTRSHGKNYDSKNLMHTFRLLDMAEEIATLQEIIVRRPNRDFLLKIRRGEFEYADLVALATERIAKMPELYQNSTLQHEPDTKSIEAFLVKIRKNFYELAEFR
jgi:hypothetical protein